MADERRFLDDLKRAAESLRRYPCKEAVVVHHDDADGLTAAAIAKEALRVEGYSTRLICIEKLHLQVAERLHAESGRLYLYVDLAASHGRLLSELNEGRNLTILLDHHDAEPASDPSVHNLDPELYGFSGESDASGAAVAYLFAKTLNEKNADLSHLAVIGSAEIPGPLRSLNEIALKDAVDRGLVAPRGAPGKEDYQVLALDTPASYRAYSGDLTILGSVGYYRNGPEMAVEACLSGFKPDQRMLVKELEENRKSVNKKLLAELYGTKLHPMRNIQWFHAGDAFQGMGVKVIGSFCSFLRFQRLVDPGKYLVGLMNMSSEIPGFGRLEGEFTKVSARAPANLEAMIRSGQRPPLSKILSDAAGVCGKYATADGHSIAASAVIPRGYEERFLSKLDEASS